MNEGNGTMMPYLRLSESCLMNLKILLQMKMKALCYFKRNVGSYWPVRHRITLI